MSTFGERVQTDYSQIVANSAAAEKEFREAAWAVYAKQGIPGRKDENWKYTATAVLTHSPWDLSPATQPASVVLPKEATQLLSAWAKEFFLVVTVDGLLREDMSPIACPANFESMNLSFTDGWSGLAGALARPGFRLEISSVLEKPILIVHAQTSAGTWSPTVNQISLANGAVASVAEVFLGFDQPYLRSQLTSAELGENAVLDWLRVQNEPVKPVHYSEVQARLQTGAQLNITQLHGGAAWGRSSLRAEILGERAGAHLSGLTFARGNQLIDQRVEVRHLKGHSESTQLFKGVLKDKARGVLNGKIYIARDAQKVASMQQNHNLLLSKSAEADTKPELEIYADDVKANHGASIGQMDEGKIFYLMSRGISRAEAQQMLAHAFAGDVLMKIGPKSLRRVADAFVKEWLPNFSAEIEHSLEGARA